MKLKTFIAPNIKEAMDMIRAELGEDAIIIANQNTGNGREVKITAALENQFNDFIEKDNVAEIINAKTLNRFNESKIRESLDYHSVTNITKEKIISVCHKLHRERKITGTLELVSKALDEVFSFSPILQKMENKNYMTKMIMGTPGAGKSTAIAKIATQAKINGHTVSVISTDNKKAGANNQLEAFTKILDIDLIITKSPEELNFTQHNIKNDYDIILIDTPGINPFKNAEVNMLNSYAQSVKCENILVMEAGRNTDEAMEIAEIFADIGVSKILATRLDLTRRIGSILSMADCCNLQFSNASIGQSIAKGLCNVDGKSLAKLILSEE